MKQLLQNEKDNSYQKFIAKCKRGLLQSVSVSQSVTDYYIQSASIITKYDGYYKVARNTSY